MDALKDFSAVQNAVHGPTCKLLRVCLFDAMRFAASKMLSAPMHMLHVTLCCVGSDHDALEM